MHINGLMQKDATPLLTPWSYISFALSYWRDAYFCLLPLKFWCSDHIGKGIVWLQLNQYFVSVLKHWTDIGTNNKSLIIHSQVLTHCGPVRHICISKLTIIGPDNGLLPSQHQVIIRPNARMLITWTIGRDFSKIISKIHLFEFRKIDLKMSSAQWQQCCVSRSVLNRQWQQWQDNESVQWI